MPTNAARLGLIALLLALAVRAPAQPTAQPTLEVNVGELLDAAQEWAHENLDADTLRALAQVDREPVEKFLNQFQQQLQGDYVLDLAALKEAARVVLPLLEAQAETKPYAGWLRSRLDYFDVAEALRKAAPIPKAVPGEPPKPLPNPSAATERQAWTNQLKPSDWPKGAAQLVSQLKPIFAAERVPEPLVWVAEVESGFNPQARSPVGAAGLFQLMPATAQALGLRRWPFDQRYQVETSGQAAARYLKRLHQRFGDWRLALAAYNAGEGRISKALQQSGGRTFEDIAPSLSVETQMYVPKIDAVLQRREGTAIDRLAPART
jgi:membrane-bound lytic murein transglycosylase D